MSKATLAKREKQEIQTTETTEQVKRTPRLRVPYVTYDYDEANEVVTLTVEMPGISKEDVEVRIQENTLTIKGLNDRRFFKRTFQFRNNLNPEFVSASMENGILTVTIRPSETESHVVTVN